MIYTDGVHIISDESLDELHEWCAKQEIGRHFYHPSRRPHYDIPKRRRDEEFPAEYATTRKLLNIMRGRTSRMEHVPDLTDYPKRLAQLNELFGVDEQSWELIRRDGLIYYLTTMLLWNEMEIHIDKREGA